MQQKRLIAWTQNVKAWKLNSYLRFFDNGDKKKNDNY
jgi:hypothetical protein